MSDVAATVEYGAGRRIREAAWLADVSERPRGWHTELEQATPRFSALDGDEQAINQTADVEVCPMLLKARAIARELQRSPEYPDAPASREYGVNSEARSPTSSCADAAEERLSPTFPHYLDLPEDTQAWQAAVLSQPNRTALSPDFGPKASPRGPRQFELTDAPKRTHRFYQRRELSMRNFKKKQELLVEEILNYQEDELLDEISEADLVEVRKYLNPPHMVNMVLGNVHCLLGLKEDWESIRRNLRSVRSFIAQLRKFKPQTVTCHQLQRLRWRLKRCHSAFAPKAVERMNSSCERLCRWVNVVVWRVGEMRFLQDHAQALYSKRAWARYQAGQLRQDRSSSPDYVAGRNEQRQGSPGRISSPKAQSFAGSPGRPESPKSRGASSPKFEEMPSSSINAVSQDAALMPGPAARSQSSSLSPDSPVQDDPVLAALIAQLPEDKVWMMQLLALAGLQSKLPDAIAWVDITGCTEEYVILNDNAAKGLAMHLKLNASETTRMLRVMGIAAGSPKSSPGIRHPKFSSPIRQSTLPSP